MCQKHHRTDPIFLKKNETPAFQAADLLAYEYLLSNRKIYQTDFGTLSMTDMRKPLQELESIPNGRDAEDWGVRDKESLPIFCEKELVDIQI